MNATLIAATALQEQRFGSGRISYKYGDSVQLEVTNTQVRVYSEGEFPNLLFSYNLERPTTADSVRKSGIINKKVAFHISRRPTANAQQPSGEHPPRKKARRSLS